MAKCANTKMGTCEYLFGITENRQDVTCIKVESFNMEETVEFESEGTDDNGNVAAVVRGPSKFTASISGYVAAGCNLLSHLCEVEIPNKAGGKDKFFVEKWSINASNNDFKKCDLTAVRYPEATICCP
jgi:hypothetical protein